jgi:xanthine dehydrogenase accessory factor
MNAEPTTRGAVANPARSPFGSDDLAALGSAARGNRVLCTLVGIEGSFSRRLGAQLAVDSSGRCEGVLADGCLEALIAAEAKAAREAGARRLLRVGAGTGTVDFRLPCGSRLEILVDPLVDADACRGALDRLARRETASLALPDMQGAVRLTRVRYIPPPRLVVLGAGPEVRALADLTRVYGLETAIHSPASREDSAGGLALGRRPEGIAVDAFTAIVVLFHDHEWERDILPWALQSEAYYIGAQGGEQARRSRRALLEKIGLARPRIDELHSPVGLIPQAREPRVLALSILSEIVFEHHKLVPHG